MSGHHAVHMHTNELVENLVEEDFFLKNAFLRILLPKQSITK